MPGVPNLFSAAYHRINKTNFHVPLNEQKTFLRTTIVKPMDKEGYFLVTKYVSNFLRTTWNLSAYHQWYAYHRLGTPDLCYICIVKLKWTIIKNSKRGVMVIQRFCFIFISFWKSKILTVSRFWKLDSSDAVKYDECERNLNR